MAGETVWFLLPFFGGEYLELLLEYGRKCYTLITEEGSIDDANQKSERTCMYRGTGVFLAGVPEQGSGAGTGGF